MRTLISKRIIKQEDTHLLEKDGERGSDKQRGTLINDGSITLNCTGSIGTLDALTQVLGPDELLEKCLVSTHL
jgi:hypothetical protein